MNYKTMFKRFIHLLAISFSCCLFVTGAVAGQNDFEQPIKVDADQNFVDGKSKVSIFRGNVNITQGSLVIDANEVEVDASDGKGKEIFIAKGSPASYSQQLDDGKRVTARADKISYSVETRIISLAGNAELLRDTNSVSGGSITYDMEKEQLLAEKSASEDSRVTTVFRPEILDDDESESDGESQDPPSQ